jgi:nitric oxide reductase activation protein
MANLAQNAGIVRSGALDQFFMVEFPYTFVEDAAMSDATTETGMVSGDHLPAELIQLKERVQAQPVEVRAALEPLVAEVMEEARFRSRVLSVARDALGQLRLDLELTRFDLDATRREREALRQRIERGQ